MLALRDRFFSASLQYKTIQKPIQNFLMQSNLNIFNIRIVVHREH